uniref:Uncharacterized protein n=1 Tax=Ditylenchus dipsaci TaxID=166011 RepID=A0A915CLX3_9BILA
MTNYSISSSEFAALLGNKNQTAEVIQIRKNFIEETLSDPKYSKMRKYIISRNNKARKMNHKTVAPTKDVTDIQQTEAETKCCEKYTNYHFIERAHKRYVDRWRYLII